MSDKYILNDDGESVLEPDLIKWSVWFEKGDRTVAKTELADGRCVSTVFLALDYNFAAVGPPVLWETMVFEPNSSVEERCEHYTSKEDAIRGHNRIVEETNA